MLIPSSTIFIPQIIFFTQDFQKIGEAIYLVFLPHKFFDNVYKLFHFKYLVAIVEN